MRPTYLLLFLLLSFSQIIYAQNFEHKLGHISTGGGDGDGGGGGFGANVAQLNSITIYNPSNPTADSLVLVKYYVHNDDNTITEAYFDTSIFRINRVGITDEVISIIDVLKFNDQGRAGILNEGHLILNRNFLTTYILKDARFKNDDIDTLLPKRPYNIIKNQSIKNSKRGRRSGNNYVERNYNKQYVDIHYEFFSSKPEEIYFHPISTPNNELGPERYFMLYEGYHAETENGLETINILVHMVNSDDYEGN